MLKTYLTKKYFFIFSHILKQKNSELRCLIISAISSFDNPVVYKIIEKEINSTKDKKMLKTIVSSLIKIKNYQYQTMFAKLLIKKCYKEVDLLEELLNQLKHIVSQPYKYPILLEDFVSLLDHKEPSIVEKVILFYNL